MKSFDEFELLLIHEGYDIPIGWANNYLVPEFQKAFTHFFKSLGQTDNVDGLFLPDPRVGEYTACDFDIDSNFKLWFLECTMNPNFRVIAYPSMI